MKKILALVLVFALVLSVGCIRIGDTSYLYRNAEKYSVGDSFASSEEIENIEISWVSGKVTVQGMDTADENFTEEITLETLSQKLSINKYYLSHIFKEITGNTIITHLNYVRCKNAKSMLLTGNYNVAECAFSCGYNNLSYFSKTYKQIFGNSPIDDLNKKEGL